MYCECMYPSPCCSNTESSAMNFPVPLAQAIRDYADLLRKGYPDKRTMELVADRHHLDRAGRAVLFRGVFREEENRRRKAKHCPVFPAGPSTLKVDALNQLYSIGSYLSGQLVFIASDGYLRDASGFHGEPMKGKVLVQCAASMHAVLHERKDLVVELFLDVQADSYGAARKALEHAFAGLEGRVRMTGSDKVDAALATATGCVVATSDTTVIDRAGSPVLDLARHVLEAKFSAKIPEIAGILPQFD